MSKKEKKRSLLLVIEILCFLAAFFLLMLGVMKLRLYENTGSAASNVNAYVGGDAYNYIINAQYAAGYFVLASGAFVGGVLCVCARCVLAGMADEAPREEISAVYYRPPADVGPQFSATEPGVSERESPQPSAPSTSGQVINNVARVKVGSRVTCPACGFEQPGGVQKCASCGIDFIYSR